MFGPPQTCVAAAPKSPRSAAAASWPYATAKKLARGRLIGGELLEAEAARKAAAEERKVLAKKPADDTPRFRASDGPAFQAVALPEKDGVAPGVTIRSGAKEPLFSKPFSVPDRLNHMTRAKYEATPQLRPESASPRPKSAGPSTARPRTEVASRPRSAHPGRRAVERPPDAGDPRRPRPKSSGPARPAAPPPSASRPRSAAAGRVVRPSTAPAASSRHNDERPASGRLRRWGLDGRVLPDDGSDAGGFVEIETEDLGLLPVSLEV